MTLVLELEVFLELDPSSHPKTKHVFHIKAYYNRVPMTAF